MHFEISLKQWLHTIKSHKQLKPSDFQPPNYSEGFTSPFLLHLHYRYSLNFKNWLESNLCRMNMMVVYIWEKQHTMHFKLNNYSGLKPCYYISVPVGGTVSFIIHQWAWIFVFVVYWLVST